MRILEYLKQMEKGFGVLSTADGKGRVNSAIYSRPHVMDDGTIAFIMLDRLSHANLQENPRAAYLFIEDAGPASKMSGVRLQLTKVREEKDSELLYTLRRVKYAGDEDEIRYLVFFKIEKVLPLIGSADPQFTI